MAAFRGVCGAPFSSVADKPLYVINLCVDINTRAIVTQAETQGAIVINSAADCEYSEKGFNLILIAHGNAFAPFL